MTVLLLFGLCSPNDPASCPLNPDTGVQYERTVKYIVECDGTLPFGKGASLSSAGSRRLAEQCVCSGNIAVAPVGRGSSASWIIVIVALFTCRVTVCDAQLVLWCVVFPPASGSDGVGDVAEPVATLRVHHHTGFVPRLRYHQ